MTWDYAHQPNNGGIGGDVFALYYDAKTKTVKGVNGSGRAPAALSLAKCRQLFGEEGKGLKKIPYTSIHAATVPGAAGAWCDMIEQWGSGMSLKNILEVSAGRATLSLARHPPWRRRIPHPLSVGVRMVYRG
jgi:gamma-glutamyltranspeptidase/glutathione hydrolase